MKTKTIQLLLMFLMVSLFTSSKENISVSKVDCKFQFTKAMECALQAGTEKSSADEEVTEYPFALAPGSYMFRY